MRLASLRRASGQACRKAISKRSCRWPARGDRNEGRLDSGCHWSGESGSGELGSGESGWQRWQRWHDAPWTQTPGRSHAPHRCAHIVIMLSLGWELAITVRTYSTYAMARRTVPCQGLPPRVYSMYSRALSCYESSLEDMMPRLGVYFTALRVRQEHAHTHTHVYCTSIRGTSVPRNGWTDWPGFGRACSVMWLGPGG